MTYIICLEVLDSFSNFRADSCVTGFSVISQGTRSAHLSSTRYFTFPILYSKTESQITLSVSFSFLKFYQSRTLIYVKHIFLLKFQLKPLDSINVREKNVRFSKIQQNVEITFSLIPAKGKKEKTNSTTSFLPFFRFMCKLIQKTQNGSRLRFSMQTYTYIYKRKTKDIFRFPFFVLCARIDFRSLVFPFIYGYMGCRSEREPVQQCVCG